VQGLWNPVTGLNTKTQDANGEVFTGNVADTLSLVFHDENTPNEAAFTHTGVQLLENGSCKTAYTEFPTGNYFIDVKHRNSLNTWSSTPINLASAPYAYDFSTDATQAYGNNMFALGAGVFGIYSGDANQDGSINIDDINLIATSSEAFAMGYLAEDLNGDGAVDALDLILADNNAAQAVSVAHP
jgi:hypothetical protein